MLELLKGGRSIRRILIADTAHLSGALGEIFSMAREAGVRVDRVPRAALDARSRTRAHQGVMAETTTVEPRSWREGLARARAAGVPPLFVALDQIQDPQNLGALLRSAEVFGAHAVLLTKRRSAAITPMVVKAAAGATEHLVIDEVASLERALAACREEGLWVVALAGEGADPIDRCDLLSEPVVVVIGAEGTGVSPLIRKRADAVVRIPMRGRVGSLNASAAGAVALWEVTRRRSPEGLLPGA